jgi:hypothetical protein
VIGGWGQGHRGSLALAARIGEIERKEGDTGTVAQSHGRRVGRDNGRTAGVSGGGGGAVGGSRLAAGGDWRDASAYVTTSACMRS